MEFLNCFKVVMYKGELMIMKQHYLSSLVMRADGSVWATCEIAPISEFEVIGDF